MNAVKFGLMVREFPFLAQVFGQMGFEPDSIDGIEVFRGDRNLLEVIPSIESHGTGSLCDYHKSREFWFVTDSGDVKKLESSFWRTRIYHDRLVASIGVQLMLAGQSLGLNLQRLTYIVEVDSEDLIDGRGMINFVRVYKMSGFHWAGRQFFLAEPSVK